MPNIMKIQFWIKHARISIPKGADLSEIGRQIVASKNRPGEAKKLFLSILDAQYVVDSVWELEEFFHDPNGEYEAQNLSIDKFKCDEYSIVFSARGKFRLPMAMKIVSQDELEKIQSEKNVYFDHGVTLQAPDLLEDPFSENMQYDSHEGLGIQVIKPGIFG